jgi:hypothetical protein
MRRRADHSHGTSGVNGKKSASPGHCRGARPEIGPQTRIFQGTPSVYKLAASFTSVAMVFMLRAVPNRAAGIVSFDRPRPLG